MKILLVLGALLVGVSAIAAENFDDVVSVSSSAGGSTVVVANNNRVVVCFQNVETSIEYCAKGSNVPTTAIYGFSLAAATSTGGTDGGRVCFQGFPAIYKFTCLAATGTGKIARTTGAAR